MRNKPTSGTELSLVTWAVKALGERLPATWSLEGVPYQKGPNKTRQDAVDAVVRLRGPDGTRSDVILETRSRIDPVDVPGVIDKVRRLARGRSVWIVAPFLSARTRDRLKEEKVNFADVTGNMWLALEKPALYIETRGLDRDPQASARPLASLKGRAAARVVRALCDFKPPYGIRELAERSETSLASIARVVALMAREAAVVRNKRGGIDEADPAALIQRWTQDYGLLRSNKVQPFLEPRDLKALKEKLKSLRARYAVTGSLAASTRTAVPPPRLGVLYVDDISAAASILGLRAVDAGANVFLVRPFDPVVYERCSKLDSVNYAAVSQVAADLLTSPGRGPADGEDLLAWMRNNPDAWRV